MRCVGGQKAHQGMCRHGGGMKRLGRGLPQEEVEVEGVVPGKGY